MKGDFFSKECVFPKGGVLGITGPIGSGKTTICKIFEVLGFSVFDCDRAAKNLYHQDPSLKNFMIDRFGKEIYDANGNLNYGRLASIVFNNKKELQIVEKEVHGRIKTLFEVFCKNNPSVPKILESAILFKTNLLSLCDGFVLVTSSFEECIIRACNRDSGSPEDIKKRLLQQKDIYPQISTSDFSVEKFSPFYLDPTDTFYPLIGKKPLFVVNNSFSKPLLPFLYSIFKYTQE